MELSGSHQGCAANGQRCPPGRHCSASTGATFGVVGYGGVPQQTGSRMDLKAQKQKLGLLTHIFGVYWLNPNRHVSPICISMPITQSGVQCSDGGGNRNQINK